MTTNQISNSENNSNSNPQNIFSFLSKAELTIEEYEKNMRDLISISQNNEGNLAQLFAIKKEFILSMIDLAIKYNDGILFIKFIINLSNIKDKLISNDINIPDLFLIYFKKICLHIESNSSLKDSPIEKIIKDYEEILLLTSDFFTKILISDTHLNNFGKYIERVAKENIFTFFIVFSIILYNLCKNSTNINIKQFIDILRLNQLPISSSGINSYIDLLCRLNHLEECQTFFEDIISYKPALKIPNKIENQTTEANTDNIINDNKIIYEKHMSSFGINIISFGIFLKYLCKNDHLDLALLYFDQMISKKMLKDEIIFNLILNGCGKKGDFKNLYRVYEEMLNNGIEPTNITMNTLIDAFIRNDEIDKAWNIFEKMFKNQITPDNFTLSTLFRGIKTQEHYDYLMKGINLVKERADRIDIILINVLLDACIKLKDSKDFLELFDNLMNGKFSNNNPDNASNENNIIKPDLITYNTFIKGCTQMKLYDKIDYVFEHLINKNDINIIPNDVTFNSLIDAYMRQNNMNKVFLLLSKMQQYHIKPDNFTYTTIIKGLNKDSFSSTKNNQSNKNNEIDLAFQLFDKVKQISKPDEILYNCIMDACLRFNQVDKMLELYKEMLENGINCSSVTYGIVIKAYGMKGDVDSALQIYEKMKLNKVKISSVTYGCLINVCTKNNKLTKAFELYELLNKEGIEMNTILYTTMIKAYSKTKNLNKVIEILNTMINSKSAKPNIITYNCVLDCCIKSDNFKLAYQYFNYLVEFNKNLYKNPKHDKNSNTNNYENLKLDIVTFSTLIKGELHRHNFGNARSLMNKMMEFDYIKLDCILLNTLLDGCEKCNCYHEALDIFYLFKKKNVEVNMMTYSILLKILGILNDFENSYKLFEEMKADKNISMNLIIITCFIKTCLSTGHIKQAIETFNSIKSYHLKPDTISYITMINGIMKNYCDNNIEFTKEIIYLVKESINDGISFQNNFYMKVINYVKNNSSELGEEFINYLNMKKVFDYQYKENKNKIYNNNVINEENYTDEKENDKDINNYKGKYNNFGYDKKRKPLRQIYKSNYNENNYYNGQSNNWKNNKGYKNNNRFNNNESNYGYKNYNEYGDKEGNYRWKNNYNKDKNYLNKKSGNNFYQ